MLQWGRIGILVLALSAILPVADEMLIGTALAAGAEEKVAVMVPTRRLVPGEIITAEDLEKISVPAESLRRSTIIAAKLLVGMEVRRTLLPGRLVSSSSIQIPVLVPRNSEVTVVLFEGTLRLLMRAKALEDGSMGELIRVANLSSGKILFASVIGAGEVQISR
ncbi:flagellar basal body P-ring formation chaperone FlgA [Rhodospirillaceae bacterium SYSU D60014]|uniref:flagellar basal body P-ring formation chaperone FlgA n=1 Tax=Virgifigura deserti TaxID=2268457 RepID=UPI000E65EFF4